MDNARIERLARVIAGLPEDTQGLNFYSFTVGGKEIPAADMYPPIGHPNAIEFFFFVCLHQHGFWLADANGYREPLYGTLDGKKCKGSDLLWKVCLRALKDDPTVFTPKRLANAGHDFIAKVFADDRGPIAFPDLKQRLSLTREYGRRMREEVMTPAGIVAAANRSAMGQPLADFLTLMKSVHGFGDKLRKKSMLLAMALANRPEKFLAVTDTQNWKPIVDYHVMRIALRSGIVTLDASEAEANASRAWVSQDEERGIRSMSYAAVERLMRRSGRSLAVVDHALWSARRFCPETEKPDCGKCAFYSACAQRTELFQPVYRTADY